MAIGENIRKAIPWIEPILDYFDWRKRIVAVVAAISVGAWSFVKDLPWPEIFVLAFSMLLMTAYALIFPAIVRMANVGYRALPNTGIWKTKKTFTLYQAACLLADQNPDENMLSDASAWFEQLKEAVSQGEIVRIPDVMDDQAHMITIPDRSAPSGYGRRYMPHSYTSLTREEFKKFCSARDRHPEFLL